MKAKPTFSLKDQLFNPEKVAYLSSLISAAYPEFQSATFELETLAPFAELELKERITHITHCLKAHLPSDYPVALDILLRALPPELDPTQSDDDFGDFILAPFSHFVAVYGCTAEWLNLSLDALKACTKRFSAEGPIRYFINAFPDETFAFLMACMADENYHVRRLASEGSRPKLPWAQKVLTDYARPIPILDQLYADSTRYVTRSVANHMNDLSKLDPDLTLETLRRWLADGRQSEKEMGFILKHSLRTLIKQGNQGALELLGYGDPPEISIDQFVTHTPTVKIGDAFEFVLVFTAAKDQNLMIDYQMQFAGDGRPGGQKVFKLKETAVTAGKQIKVKKRHPMRLMTTRQLYPGVHTISLQINGQSIHELSFELVV